MADKTKMTPTEAANVLTPFKNIFRAAERLEEACAVATGIDGEVAARKREIKQEEAALKAAVEARKSAEEKLAVAVHRHDEAK